MLFIPGANAAMLSTSFVYGADAVMFDLKMPFRCVKKIPPACWFIMRCSIRSTRMEKVVRINPLNTPFGLADLEAVVRAAWIWCACRKPIAKKISMSWKRTLSALSANAAAKWAAQS
jgi:citrate lyase subunit beta/citryl-CoA lyase